MEEIENVLSFFSLCQLAIDKKFSAHSKSILYPKAECLNKVSISFASYSIKQHGTVEYLGCHFDSRLRD